MNYRTHSRYPGARHAALLLATMAWLALGAAPTPAAADADTGPAATAAWTAVAATGLVEARPAISPQPSWSRVTRGDELKPATLVRTGRAGRTTLSRHASLLIIDPESHVELPVTPSEGMETSVIQRSGSVLYDVDSREQPHFEVVTPYLVAGVKGTEFLVTVNDDYAAVTVRSGLVEVTNPDTGETRGVGAGESLIRERDRTEFDLIDPRRARTETKRLTRMNSRATDPEREAGSAASGATRQAGIAANDWPGHGTRDGAHNDASVLDDRAIGDDQRNSLELADEIDSRDEVDTCGTEVSICDPGDATTDPGDGSVRPPITDPIGPDPVVTDPINPDPTIVDLSGNNRIPAGGTLALPAGLGAPQSPGSQLTGPSEALLMFLDEQKAELERAEREVEHREADRSKRRGAVNRTR